MLKREFARFRELNHSQIMIKGIREIFHNPDIKRLINASLWPYTALCVEPRVMYYIEYL
jgi:hypothetical protein